MAMSDSFDADGIGVGRECPEVLDISAEDNAARFGTGYNDGVHRGAAPRRVAELACTSGERRRQSPSDIAGLEQPIHGGIIALTPRDRLGEDDGRNHGWPLSVADERADGGDCILGPLGEEAQSP